MKKFLGSLIVSLKNVFIGFKHLFGATVIEEDVLSGINIDIDRLYDDPQVAIDIQNQYMDNAKRLDILRPKYKKHVEYVTILQRIDLLSSKVKKDLERMSQIYSETMVQKGEYRDQMQKKAHDQSEYLEQYEDKMEDVLKMMQGHEDNQRHVKQDLAYLESEKSELLYQSRRLKSAYRFVKSSFIIIAFLAALVAFVLSLMYFVYKKEIMLTAMISMVAVIIATVWVYVFRRYLTHEINKNQKLMKRAIELINKTKIKFINNQKVIDYQCRKYKVDSSEMLAMRWSNYKDKENAKAQYKNISNSIAAMIMDIEDLLKKNGIEDSGIVLDYLDYFVTKQGRKLLMTKLNDKKEELKLELAQAEKENDVINLVLTNYKSHVASNRSQSQ